MPVHLIPDRLAVPAAWAAAFTVDSNLTARDLSYSLAVGWLAAQRDPSFDGQDILLGDNGLRMALNRSRRDKAATEDARVFRTSAAKASVPSTEDPVAVPSLSWETTYSGGIRVHRGGMRTMGDQQLQWHVPAAVAAAMRVKDGEPSVELPWALVQNARNRMSVIVMLRILTVLADEQVKQQMEYQVPRYRHASMRFQLDKLLAWFGLPTDSEVKEVMRKHLVPATAEILEHTGYRVTIEEHRTVYKRGPRAGKEGPLRGMIVNIAYPVIKTPLAYPKPRLPGTAWKPEPKFHKPAKPQEPAPAIIHDIVPFPDDDDDWDPLDDADDDAIPSGREQTDVPVSPAPVKRRFGIKRLDS